MKQTDQTDTKMHSRDEVERLVIQPAKRLLTKNNIVRRIVDRLAKDDGVKEEAAAQQKSSYKLAEEKLHEAMVEYAMGKLSGEERLVLPELGNDKRMVELRNAITNMLDDRVMVYNVAKAPAVQAEIEKTVQAKTEAKLVEGDEVDELRKALTYTAMVDAEEGLLPRTRHNVLRLYETQVQQIVAKVDGLAELQHIHSLVVSECRVVKAAQGIV